MAKRFRPVREYSLLSMLPAQLSTGQHPRRAQRIPGGGGFLTLGIISQATSVPLGQVPGWHPTKGFDEICMLLARLAI